MRLIDADALPKYTGYALSADEGCNCTACGFDIGNDLDFMEYVKYCPACGAKMRGEQDE